MRTKLVYGAAVAALAFAAASAASAQSTGSETVDEVVVTAARGAKNLEGVITAETAPRARSTITQDYISTQAPGQVIMQTLNIVPGLNFTNNDPYGASGGNVRLRGFDGNRIALTLDGVPQNDTGNYAIYSNMFGLDSELIEQANVNTGSTDADTPTASSTGGVVNYTLRKPGQDFGVMTQTSVGSNNMRRVFAVMDSGEFGPFGTRAFVSGSYQNYDKFKGWGDLTRWQVNGRLWQDLAKPGDFMSLALNYGEMRNYAYYSPNLGTSTGSIAPEVETKGWDVDYNNIPFDNNFWGGRINPSNSGSIRGKSRFTLTDSLTLTVDPSFQYTLANGGSQYQTIRENDAKIKGAATSFACPIGQSGKDLNDDGDCLDTVRYMSPSNTKTRRYGVNSSLIWDLNDDHRLRLAGTLDKGRHRQSGEFSTVGADGFFDNWFGGKPGDGGEWLTAADGAKLSYRNRFSVALLKQVALEYRGNLFDDHLNVTAALQHKTFERELNQFCYTQNGTSTALCTSEVPNATLPNGNVTFASQGTKQYIAPFAYDVSFSKTLPNVGASWKFGDGHSTFVSYSEQMSALRTDSFYTVQRLADGGIGSLNAKPELTDTIEAGYRYQGGDLLASVTVFHTNFENRIVSTYDPDADIYRERNVGSVESQGAEAQFGYQASDALSFGGSVSYNDATYQNDLLVNPGQYAPIEGKKLVETPEWMSAGWVKVAVGPFDFGLQGKYVGERFATDVNDLAVDGYFLLDANARWSLEQFGWDGSYLQLNAWNLSDERYYGNLGTRVTAEPGQPGYGQPYGSIGAPRTFQLTLRTRF